MFPGCPEHSNVEGTLSEHSPHFSPNASPDLLSSSPLSPSDMSSPRCDVIDYDDEGCANVVDHDPISFISKNNSGHCR